MVRGEGKGISLHPCPFKEEECQDQVFLALVLARGTGLPEQILITRVSSDVQIRQGTWSVFPSTTASEGQG